MSAEYLISQLEAENLELRQRMEQLRDDVGIPTARVLAGRLVETNQSWAVLFGFNQGRGLSGGEFLDHIVPTDRDRIKVALNRLERKEPSSELLIFEAFRADGSTMGLRLDASSHPTDQGTEIELTGHSDQRGDENNPIVLGRLRLSRELSAWQPEPDAIAGLAQFAILDLQALEDRAGFADAGMVADELERLLEEAIEPDDRCFRLDVGGFAILMRRASDSELEFSQRSLAERIINHRFRTRRADVRIDLYQRLHKLPDRVMPESVLRSLRRDSPADDSASWRKRIEQALAKNSFRLSYLAVEAFVGRKINYEVVVRLVDDHGLEHPLREFDEPAGQSGLMGKIDRWTITHVVDELRKSGPQRSRMFLKLSSETVREGPAFVAWLKSKIDDRMDLLQRIVFEMSEPTVIANPSAATQLADELKLLGAELSLFRARGQDIDKIESMPLDWIRLESGCEIPLLGERRVPPALEQLMDFAQRNDIRLCSPYVDPERGPARLWRWGVSFMATGRSENPVG